MPIKPTQSSTPFCGLILCALSLSIMACQGPENSADKPSAKGEATAPIIVNETVINADTGLTISNAYVKPPLPGRDVSAIYFTISNGTQADRLTGVYTSLSDHAEIHTHIKEGDIMKMRRIETLDLKPRATVPFKPGGYHIMVFGTELSSVATDAEMTLIFENAGEALLTIPIQGRPRNTYKSSKEPVQNSNPENGAKEKSHH